MTISATLARFFSDPWERPAAERNRIEPRLTATASAASANTNTAIADQTQATLALPAPDTSPSQTPRHDLRNISPRQFADVTHELYMEGTLNWEEFKMLGVPSELDPRYDQTIGALTGEKAEPDKPKDMLGHWEQRVDFEKRYNPSDEQVATAESVLQKLTWQTQAPLRMSA